MEKTVFGMRVNNEYNCDGIITHCMRIQNDPDDLKKPLYANPEKTLVKTKGVVTDVVVYTMPKTVKRGFLSLGVHGIKTIAEKIAEIESIEGTIPLEEIDW